MRSLLGNNKIEKDQLVQFDNLLNTMKTKEVHYLKNCDCQDVTCQMIRDVLKLVKFLISEIAKEHPIFRDTDVQVVGSLKEGTKVFDLYFIYLIIVSVNITRIIKVRTHRVKNHND